MSNFNVPIIGEGMKHETEINHLKNVIKQIQIDFAAFTSILIEAGIVEVNPENPVESKVNKVVVKDDEPEVQQD